VILAAGASRRMGKNKMLLELDGESLIRRAAKRALAAGLSPLVVVVGCEADRLRAELKDLPLVFAVNSATTGPTSGSLHQGLNALSSDVDAVVVMLGDMVRVTTETLAMLIAAARGPRPRSWCRATVRSPRRRCCSGGRCLPSCWRGREKDAARPSYRRTSTKPSISIGRKRCSWT